MSETALLSWALRWRIFCTVVAKSEWRWLR